MSRWFRHYAGMMRDDKLVRVAMKSGQTIERVLWIWGAILESAAEVNDEGAYDLDAAEAAYFLRADQDDVDSVLAALEAIGRVASSRVVKWSDRQFQSDRSAERTKRYRDGRKQVDDRRGDDDVTSQGRRRDAPETETETETEEDTAVAIAPAVERVVALPKPTKARSSRRCPAAWMPSPQDLAVVEALGFSPGQIERELATLKDHEFRDAKTDWSATFRNWFRRKDPPREQRHHASQTPNGRAEKRSVWADIAANGDPAAVGRA